MSSNGSSNLAFNDEQIAAYLDKLRREKNITLRNITSLEKEQSVIDEQIAELERRRNEVRDRLQSEHELCVKQEKAITQAETAYQKIRDSSESLADFVRTQYQDSRRE